MKNKGLSTKLVVITLIMALFALSFAGCNNDKIEADKAETENMTTEKVTAEQAGTEGESTEEKSLYVLQTIKNTENVKRSDETPVGQVIKDKFNIVFEYMPYTGDLRERQNLMLAAGDYPELCELQRNDIVLKYIEAGVALPLDDYLADMPNFTEKFAEQIPIWRTLTEDGKLYKFDSYTPNDFELKVDVFDIYVRTDILEQQGWLNLLSTDDWIEFIKKAKADNPEINGQSTIGMIVPFAEAWGIQGISGIMYEKGGRYSAVGGNEGVIFNHVEDRFEDYMTNEYVKESLQFFNTLYKEGLLDKECFTDYSAQVQEKLNSGRAITAWYTGWMVNSANSTLRTNGNENMEYIDMPVRSSLQMERDEKRQIRVETTRPFNAVVITDKAKYPERIIELIEWTCTEEGQMLLQCGIESEHYTNENGQRVPTQEYIDGILGDSAYTEKQGTERIFEMLPRMRIVAADGLPYDLTSYIEYKDEMFLSDREKEAYTSLGWDNSKDYWLQTSVAAPSGVIASVMIDPSSELGSLHAKLVDFRVKASAELILADNFEETYEKLIGEYKKLNPEKIVDKYNEMYDATKAKIAE